MIRAANLATLAAVRHGFFTRKGGVSKGRYASLNCGLGSGDEPAHVAENRARAMAMLGLAGGALCTAFQTHGTTVRVVDGPWPADQRPKADAMITRTPGIALGVLTADCAPVLLAEARAGIIGVAHAGWKGALSGVIEAAVEAMGRLGAERGRIVAAVGPCIAQESYEVGPEFPEPFLADDPANARFFAAPPREDRHRFDLMGYVVKRLHAAGIATIDGSGHDTVRQQALFFSYRRARLEGERDYGRGLSAIALKP